MLVFEVNNYQNFNSKFRIPKINETKTEKQKLIRSNVYTFRYEYIESLQTKVVIKTNIYTKHMYISIV